MTTEGLFIDDVIRKQPQREWDVKAWSVKLIEVFCPRYSPPPPSTSSKSKSSNPVRKLFGDKDNGDKEPTEEEMNSIVDGLQRCCYRDCFQLKRGGNLVNGTHVVRASIRDAEGTKYVFLVDEDEGWKISEGMRRLRGGSLARGLIVEVMGREEAGRIIKAAGAA
jgi:hypothetical protein